ncbi:hypothetical protein DYB28_007284 [Aphanomyces astaci]|uniref:Amino acid transporter transmembrane domain-containing protein n=1 Tax=Aphanomyces astaci TaxID=112090 RepID=A0A9X8H5J4_APHAT|nr:hypothetical protein DYB28_007284 [Aphanomyces astaci]
MQQYRSSMLQVCSVCNTITEAQGTMAGDSSAHVGTYSPTTGFIFLFNLVVGTGALTIPHAFAQVGLIYGAAALFLLSVVSYVSGTYVIEAIAGVNALQGFQQQSKGVSTAKLSDASSSTATVANTSSVDETTSEAVPFLVHTELELAAIAQELFSPRGVAAFYVCMIAYLYGDLAIYAVGTSIDRPNCSKSTLILLLLRRIAIPKSLREVICPRPTTSAAVVMTWDCPALHMNSSVLYRALVALFGVSLAPFAMGHMQKTALIQIATTVMRHLSFALMIVLACAVFALYVVLSCSAAFRYLPQDIQDVYTLNFTSYPNAFIAYFLSLFPVFTLSTSFPIIAITLRENLRTLFHANSSQHVSDMTMFGLLAIVPPLVIAFFTEDVGMLVGVTGAYAGLAIQWVIPASFVYCLRQRLVDVGVALKLQGAPKNPFASSFGGLGWLALLMGLSAVSLLLITYTRVFK